MQRVVLCLPEGASRVDPAPEETAKRDVALAFAWEGSAAGLVGHAEGGIEALELAAEHGELVERLVLVSTPVPESDAPLPAVAAKVLLLFGSRDGGSARATWWKEALGGRIEMVPGEGADILERVWPRVLSHVAPGALRK
jgi:pimeloyl-ACP methyl ester carboxylesterase